MTSSSGFHCAANALIVGRLGQYESVLLFYVDECGGHALVEVLGEDGKPGLKEGSSPYFVLSAVGVRDSSRRPLAEALFEIKQRHFGESATKLPWAETEIKGRYLQRASRSVAVGKTLRSPAGYAALDTTEKVSQFSNDIGLLFDKYRPLTFTVAVDKAQLLGKDRKRTVEPLGAAYAYLHQRIALSLEKLYAGESAILIADQQAQHEKFFRSGQMNAARDRLSGGLVLKPNFDLVIDKPLWVDTDHSSWDRELIQLADVVAYTTTQCMIDKRAPAHRNYLWPQIRNTLALHWRTGKINAGGFAVYPKSSAFPTLEND